MNILDVLADASRERVAEYRRSASLSQIREEAEQTVLEGFPFEAALSREGLSVIAEIKKASPSKGLIDPVFNYMKAAEDYDQGGADAISCLTEPTRFLGSDRYLAEIASKVSIPVLRKDFTVDEYMVYQARCLGASAVLLIAALLDDVQLRDFFQAAESVGLSCLFEAHDESEVERVLKAGARVVGVNNRNLKDFSVNTSLSASLKQYVPSGVLFVAESGVMSIEAARGAYKAGADAVLVGEMLMRSSDKPGLIKAMKGL